MNKELIEKAFRIAFAIDDPTDPYEGSPTVNKYNYVHWLKRLQAAIEDLEGKENETL
jgi:hypothetical protein